MTREQFEKKLHEALIDWYTQTHNSAGLSFVDWRQAANKDNNKFDRCWRAMQQHRIGLWNKHVPIFDFVRNNLTGYEQALLVAWHNDEDPTDWQAVREKQEQPKEQPRVDPYAACRERRDANGQLLDQPRAVLYRPGWTGPMRDQVRELRVPGFDDPTGDDL